MANTQATPQAEKPQANDKRNVKKDILRLSGGERVVDWNKYFGMGLYGAFLSILVGILILIFPMLMPILIGLFLIFMGLLEILRYMKRKVVSAVKSI